MRKATKTFVYIAALLMLLLGVFFGLKRLSLWLEVRDVSRYTDYPSLIPEIQRTMAVRFDPSFYYKGERPKKMAARLAKRWEMAGVNLVFYRAYDPKYGSFYRTKYDLNLEGEFGKYDLLKHIIRECHARNIRVFAWLPVLNHHGAWEAHPEWRTKRAGGEDFSDTGLEFPLCARIPEVRAWWYDFVADLLKNYPGIDGIDLGEPVVSWKKGDACACESCSQALEKSGAAMAPEEIRAQPLTTLLKKSIALTRLAGKQASVTFVVSASSSGEIFNFEQTRDLTGFDLESLLHAEAHEIPDIICPEFLWQEWKSRYPVAKDSSQPFSPEWTEQAFGLFLREIDVPIQVVIHLEITDFPKVEVSTSAFEASLKAALEGGASGFDIYDSSQLDEKDAWSVLARFKDKSKKKKCLILYDEESNRNDAIQTGELLRHFHTEITFQSLDSYTPGAIHEYDNVFYVGTEWRTDIPASLIEDILNLNTSFCWLGFNIESLLGQEPLSNILGLQYLATVKDQYRNVSYKNRMLKKEDPWMAVVRVSRKKQCQIIAWASDGKDRIPYAVRSGRHFWFFADVPTSYAIEGGRFLVFADILHDILNEDHVKRHLALLRIEDIHPLTDPKILKKIADYLHSQGIPFQVAFVPYYVFPKMNVRLSLSEKPEFVEALKHMVKKGGTLVMHGVTHQRFEETTTDYEFWDPVNDSSVEGQTKPQIRQRIERGLHECWSNGIYPLIWVTPHYAGSQEFYSVISEFFSLSMERRQAIDMRDTDQYLPYAIFSDRYGQIIMPENLGYIPLDKPKAEVVTEPAKKMKVVRDGVASFFFHPFINIRVLKDIVRKMKQEHFSFTNATGLPVRVETSFGILQDHAGSVNVSPENFIGQEKRLAFPGIVLSQQDVMTDPMGEFKKQINLEKGELYLVQFPNPDEESPQAGKEEKERKSPEVMKVLQSVADHQGESCQVPLPLLLVDSRAKGALEIEIRSFESIFALVGVELQKKDVEEFNRIPPGFNLVILPSASAALLDASQIEMIMDSLKRGDISLITSGFSPLADELGIEKKPKQIEVFSVVDTFYPDVRITWERSVPTHIFDSPQDAVFIYTDKETETPLLISSTLGKGKYIFLGTPLDEKSGYGCRRYPYFLTHVFRFLKFFPMIRSASAEVFFNPAEREDIAIEDLVKFWRRIGVRIIHAAAWQIFPEWSYDYERLIHLAHTNAMLVYAWLEPPYVNERFWMEHPGWREKNYLGEDAILGWRKPMALGDPQIRSAVLEEWRSLLEAFNWDGVMLNRLGFESEGGAESPEKYTPYHSSVRERFRAKEGFDPVELFNPESSHYWKHNSSSFQIFKKFRSSLAQNYTESLLAMLSEVGKSDRNFWEIILTHDSRRSDSGIGLETLRDFKRRYGAKIQLIPKAKDQWTLPRDEVDLLQLFISPNQNSSTFHSLAPTKYPTGLALYTMLKKFISHSQRITLYSESSLYEVDTLMLPFILASGNYEGWANKYLSVRMHHSGEIIFSDQSLKELAIDGVPAGSFYRNRLLIPVGKHKIVPADNINNSVNSPKSKTRLVDCSGDLLSTKFISRGIEIEYRSDKRMVLITNEKPLAVYLDDERIRINPERGLAGWAIILPGGRHSASIVTQSILNSTLTFLSWTLSNGIVVISSVAVVLLISIFAISLVRSRLRSKR